MTNNGFKVISCKIANNSKRENMNIKFNNVHSKTVATDIERSTPHANKTRIIEVLKLQLIQKRFENINEIDLIDGHTFLDNLDKV